MPNYRPGRSSRTGGNAGEQLVSFTMHDAQRINRAVSIVERERRLPNKSALPRAAGGATPPSSIKAAFFQGSWGKGNVKTVLLRGTSSPFLATTVTANVLNAWADISVYNLGNKLCLFATVGDQNILVSVGCD